MRRLLAVLFGAMFLVVATAGSALAADDGNKTYTWPLHCNTRLVLYLHGWFNGYSVVDGRMDVHTCTGTQGITAIVFDDMVLYRNRRDSSGDHISQIGYAGYKNAPINNADYTPVYSTSDVSCGFGSGDLRPADDVWVNADYQIFWENGTHTAKRDNNSNAVAVYTSNLC